jgi:hypothetical protein
MPIVSDCTDFKKEEYRSQEKERRTFVRRFGGHKFTARERERKKRSILRRFVILHHQSPGEDHWDVMLETESDLRTWSIPPQCPSGSSFTCPASRLSPHRKHYLDYEGKISGNRGTVFRVDAGTYEQRSPEAFFLYGTHFIGTLTLDNEIMKFVREC